MSKQWRSLNSICLMNRGDVGVKRGHFDAIAAGSLTNLFVTQNPRKVKSREDVLEMLEAAY